MRDYSLDKDVSIKENPITIDELDFEDDDWEPKEVVAIDNLRLDPEAAKIYREIRKARERRNTGSRMDEEN